MEVIQCVKKCDDARNRKDDVLIERILAPDDCHGGCEQPLQATGPQNEQEFHQEFHDDRRAALQIHAKGRMGACWQNAVRTQFSSLLARESELRGQDHDELPRRTNYKHLQN